MIGLGCKKGADETWRQAVERIAARYGLQVECLEIFDREVTSGEDPAQAAWNALYEWDCLSTINTNELIGDAAR